MPASPDDLPRLYFPSDSRRREQHQGVYEIDKNSERILPTLQISEVKTNAAAGSEAKESDPDWIELLNAGSEAVDLTGYGLSDNKDEPFRFKFRKTPRFSPVNICLSIPANMLPAMPNTR